MSPRDTEENHNTPSATPFCLEVRSALNQATRYLAANRGLTPQEAREWILQEAMAKRAGLVEVAQAIVIGETVAYRYNTPVRTSR